MEVRLWSKAQASTRGCPETSARAALQGLDLPRSRLRRARSGPWLGSRKRTFYPGVDEEKPSRAKRPDRFQPSNISRGLLLDTIALVSGFWIGFAVP